MALHTIDFQFEVGDEVVMRSPALQKDGISTAPDIFRVIERFAIGHQGKEFKVGYALRDTSRHTGLRGSDTPLQIWEFELESAAAFYTRKRILQDQVEAEKKFYAAQHMAAQQAAAKQANPVP